MAATSLPPKQLVSTKSSRDENVSTDWPAGSCAGVCGFVLHHTPGAEELTSNWSSRNSPCARGRNIMLGRSRRRTKANSTVRARRKPGPQARPFAASARLPEATGSVRPDRRPNCRHRRKPTKGRRWSRENSTVRPLLCGQGVEPAVAGADNSPVCGKGAERSINCTISSQSGTGSSRSIDRRPVAVFNKADDRIDTGFEYSKDLARLAGCPRERAIWLYGAPEHMLADQHRAPKYTCRYS